MNRTETPPLDIDALHRLWDSTNLFVPDFRFRRQAEWAAVYIRALLQDGERKSVEPFMLAVAYLVMRSIPPRLPRSDLIRQPGMLFLGLMIAFPILLMLLSAFVLLV